MINMIKELIGTKNKRTIKKYKKQITKINDLEQTYSKLPDDMLKEEYLKLKKQVQNKEVALDDILENVFAMTREASKRVLNMRHFDVQLIGGIVIHQGKIAEMKTGEGKTLVATLPVILNAMTGEGVHIVTVNDYLAKRDSKEMEPLYNFFGLSVGTVLENMMMPLDKKKQYEADITYGTNNEFGFDYLRDNMSYDKDEMVQRNHKFVIIDEIDSILIDEARTPLVISGPAKTNAQDYKKADEIAKILEKDKDFTIDEKDKVVLITEEGIAKAEELFAVENLYAVENVTLSHVLNQALKANYLFEKDVDYVHREGEIVIVDEFTGRLSDGRRFSEGLHQALEAKEGTEIKEETQTLAEITFQNYFRMYEKIAGMTGTADTEATEFSQIYSLDVVSIPTNLPVQRKDLNDLIYKTELEKHMAILEKIQELAKIGQPVLIGTASIDKSESFSNYLTKKGIKHTVLNAKNHEQEGEIIKNAGQKGAVTIATNMAGRGVDIKVDDEVKALGGLYIIGTERHENRRIDNQLRGRSGRQGDNGTTQFYLSLEDNLLRIFGSDKIKTIMEGLGVKDGEYIESKMVSRAVEKAQKKVESIHFEGRKNIVEYDDVINEQRKIVYKFRNQLLGKTEEPLKLNEKIEENRRTYVEFLLSEIGVFPSGYIEKEQVNLLSERLKEDLNIDMDFQKDEIEYEELFNFILDHMHSKYNEKMNFLNAELKEYIEKDLYLKELDDAWRNHLYEIDNMKEGIRLRAYNQKDPLVEYKKESYNLFQEFTQNTKTNICKTLQKVEFQIEEPKEYQIGEEEE